MKFSQVFWFAKQGYTIRRESSEAEYAYNEIWQNLYQINAKQFYNYILQPNDYAAEDWIVVGNKVVEPRNMIEIYYKKIQKDEWAEPAAPFHAHDDDRGFDLTCVAKEPAKDDEGNEIPNVWRYHSGLVFQFPEGLDAEFRARSSVYKTGLMLSNGVGTIDHGYRGEVQGVFYDILKQPLRHYKPGDRFGQLIIPGIDPRFIEFIQVDELTETDRGAGGYGSSGK